MKPETKDYLASAQRHLGYARRNLSPDNAPVGAREAYMAAFHAAQALIYERTGKPGKTHNGTQIRFQELGRTSLSSAAAGVSFFRICTEIERRLFVERGADH